VAFQASAAFFHIAFTMDAQVAITALVKTVVSQQEDAINTFMNDLR